jgi:hypothetical protein
MLETRPSGAVAVPCEVPLSDPFCDCALARRSGHIPLRDRGHIPLRFTAPLRNGLRECSREGSVSVVVTGLHGMFRDELDEVLNGHRRITGLSRGN